jgi:hypothetical protein
MPIRPQPELEGLGRGISGLVTQTTNDAFSTFALKHSVPGETKTFSEARYRSLISELCVLQHDKIKTHPNIIDLIGITWDIEPMSLTAWPVFVTQKADCGDLDSFLFSNDFSTQLDFDTKVRICAGILDGLGVLHVYSSFLDFS